MSEKSGLSFEQMFEKATGYAPHLYQVRLAHSHPIPSIWNLPTGSGKTATAVLNWVWRTQYAENIGSEGTSKRLVYCLPMRSLVEQTKKAVDIWLKNLGLSSHIQVHLLMGGESSSDWTSYPEKPAILIGTQDMLLSRALNRGYGSSRAKWPMEFGLLNNDSFWVMDEVQLMGPGLETSAQLAGMRNRFSKKPRQTVWMSATVDPDWIATVDFPGPITRFALTESETPDHSTLKQVVTAKKSASAFPASGEAKAIAPEVIAQHQKLQELERSILTLVVVNTVKRAQELFAQIEKTFKKQSDVPEIMLIHSRFRQADRKALSEQLNSPVPQRGRIVFATQVIEAGIDISANLLISELAPWSSLVQRLGRLNRRGELADGRFFWIDLAENEAKPYEYSEIAQSREILATIAQGNSQVGIEHLPNVALKHEDCSILRQRDLMELFDTTPDLAGQDIDISSYIRDGDDRDVQVYWRHVAEDASDPGEESSPLREELCTVPVSSLKKCASKIRAWTQGFLDGEWKTLEKTTAIPGQIWLIAADSGRYTTQIGWDETSDVTVGVFSTANSVVETSTADDPYSMTENDWQSIAQHTDNVCSVLETILSELSLSADDADHLRLSARYHDLGKAHFAFQEKLKKEILASAPAMLTGQHLAKAPKSAWARTGPRRYFRHELASALACLQWNLPNLVTYLVGAHHGKVRQSIRSLPNESEPKDERLFARGVHDGDLLPEVDLGGGIKTSPITLSLEPMRIGVSPAGNPSWVDRALDLRDTHGVFHLGYLEAILRAADHRASANKD